MGDVRDVEGPSVLDQSFGHSSPADIDGPRIVKTGDFMWKLPGEVALETEEKLLAGFWLAAGSWNVRVDATLAGGGDFICVGTLLLTTNFDDHSAAQPAVASVMGKNREKMRCILRPTWDQVMPLTFSALRDSQGKCSIKDILLVAEKRA